MIAADAGWALHHIGFVVSDIAANGTAFANSLGASWDHAIYEDPAQRVRVTFLSVKAGAPLIELVEPLEGLSPVRAFLSKGGGLHHVCYEVSDLESAIAVFKSRGALVAKRPKPAIAFQDRRIAWVLTAEKLLVELLEGTARETPGNV